MPSHPKTKTKPSVKCPKHAGGPVRRKDENWENAVGPSIDAFPGTQLPKLRTVLQRYRSMRIMNPDEQCPLDELAKQITAEIIPIWQRAGIPIIIEKNCLLKVKQTIQLWTSIHNSQEASDKLSEKLDCLLDLAPKLRGKVSDEDQNNHLRELMRQTSHREKSGGSGSCRNWEQDFEFYLDQKVEP